MFAIFDTEALVFGTNKDGGNDIPGTISLSENSECRTGRNIVHENSQKANV